MDPFYAILAVALSIFGLVGVAIVKEYKRFKRRS